MHCVCEQSFFKMTFEELCIAHAAVLGDVGAKVGKQKIDDTHAWGLG